MEIDWFAHYKQKLPSLSIKRDDLPRFENESRELLAEITASNPRKVIEVGCGLARDSFVLASKKIEVTAFDHDENILRQVRKNAEHLGADLNVVEGDFFQLSKYFPASEYDLAFHSGVLEHFSDEEIEEILKQQLTVAHKVTFTVPVFSNSNTQYFNDSLYRRLLRPEDWQMIVRPFRVTKIKEIKSRHDDLLVVIER